MNTALYGVHWWHSTEEHLNHCRWQKLDRSVKAKGEQEAGHPRPSQAPSPERTKPGMFQLGAELIHRVDVAFHCRTSWHLPPNSTQRWRISLTVTTGGQSTGIAH
jgi:hypothetical protein